MNVLNKPISLSLNSNWKVVNVRTIADAIVDLCGSETTGAESCEALDIQYELNDDGTPNFNNVKSIQPLTWSEWIKLPVNDWDFAIRSVNMTIRAPTVTVAKNYTKIPKKLFRKKPNKEGIFIRDKGICQYTGKKLTRHNASIDHVIPKSKFKDKNDANTWTNMVLCDKNINYEKGNKFNHEAGIKLIKNPVVPSPVLVCDTITEIEHPSWIPFIDTNK